MSSRERKRAERRKRKDRGGSHAAEPVPAAARAEPNGAGPNIEDLAAAAEAGGPSRSELRNEQARAELEPLAKGERPGIVTIGALVSVGIALSIVIGYLAGAEVSVGASSTDTDEANLFQVVPPALLFAIMAWGMWRARYWAVLGFEAIMAILMVGSFITLIAATSVFKAVSAGLVLVLAGLLFWFTVKALARIQMPTPGEREPRR